MVRAFLCMAVFSVMFAAFCVAKPITVTIKDPSGAFVPEASIQIRAKSAGFLRALQTGKDGTAAFPDLPDGEYILTVTRSGFEQVQQEIVISGKSIEEITVELKLATTTEEVEVAGGVSKKRNADPVYRALRDAALSESYVVEGFRLQRDAGFFELKRGTVTFVAPVNGRVTKAVFIGDGEFSLVTDLASDRQFLKLLTGSDELKESFRSATFVFTDSTYEEIKKQGKAGALDGKAAGVLSDFHQQARHRTEIPRTFLEAMLTGEDIDNIDADLLAELYRPDRTGFFSAYFGGSKHKDLRFHHKPLGVLAALRAPEETALLNVDTGGENEGILYLSHALNEWKRGSASSHEDKRIISAEHYQIETVLGRGDKLNAIAKIRFSAVRPGDRVIKFSLLPNLRVSRVGFGEADIDFIQQERKSDGSFYVIMPKPMQAGEQYDLTIEYAGNKVVQNAGGGNYYVGARTSWYPSVNAFNDRSTFDLTFKVPKPLTLVSIGKLAKEWKEDKFNCTQWTSSIPVPVAGFNYGEFKRKTLHDDATQYELEGYAISEVPGYLKGSEVTSISASQLSERAMIESQNAIRIFDRWFGKPLYGRLALTQQPDFSFGQSWPGLVYLPLSAFLDSTQRWQLMGGINQKLTDFVQEVTPHEVAHQWWGHMVGWASFHDQWISEGFADFSAGLYLQLTEPKPDKYLKYWKNAREVILEKNQFGRSANDAGPLWLGLRLNSFRNAAAYRKLIYPKGGYVLHMLRMMLYDEKTKDEEFIKMMRDFVETHLQKNASTESFRMVVNRHMKPQMDLDGNKTMNWFFDQFVYGTEVPKYDFQYSMQDEGNGAVTVKASLTQSMVSDQFRMLVPLYADFDGRYFKLGEMRVVGNSTLPEFSFRLPKKPKRLLINAYYDVLERERK